MISDYVYRWLDNALDFGISEHEFWDMTLGELERAFDSKRRIQLREAQERASFDYALAELIGRSVNRIYSSSATMPEIYEVYPTLFDSKEAQEQKQAKIAELSALRFKQFANFHNKKINKEVANVK